MTYFNEAPSRKRNLVPRQLFNVAGLSLEHHVMCKPCASRAAYSIGTRVVEDTKCEACDVRNVATFDLDVDDA